MQWLPIRVANKTTNLSTHDRNFLRRSVATRFNSGNPPVQSLARLAFGLDKTSGGGSTTATTYKDGAQLGTVEM